MGCSPWGRKESDTTERLHFHFSLSRSGEGNGNPLQCSCPENSRDGEAWWAAIYGVSQSRTRLKRLSSSSNDGGGVRQGDHFLPHQIHQKNISLLSKFHKTTSECQQSTAGTQKSSPLSSKGGGKNIKDKKRDKRWRDGAPSPKGSLKKREVSKHQETLSLPSLWQALEAQRAT